MEGVTRVSIRPLLELQRIDSATDRLNARRADLPEQREVDEITGRRDEMQAALTEKKVELDGVVREQTRLEAEVAQIETKIESEQQRLYSGDIANPRELSNIQAELDALRRRKTHLEDEDLEVMERREGLEAEVTEMEKGLAETEAALADASSRRDAATVEIDRELGELAEQRTGVAGGLSAELVEFYEDLRGKFGGIAVGALESGTCRACSLPLSPVQRDEIKRGDDPIIRCENCRRLLVIV